MEIIEHWDVLVQRHGQALQRLSSRRNRHQALSFLPSLQPSSLNVRRWSLCTCSSNQRNPRMGADKAKDGIIARGGGDSVLVIACSTAHKDTWACCMPAKENLGQKKRSWWQWCRQQDRVLKFTRFGSSARESANATEDCHFDRPQATKISSLLFHLVLHQKKYQFQLFCAFPFSGNST